MPGRINAQFQCCGNLGAGAEIEELMRALSLRPYFCEAHCMRPSALRASIASFGSIISAPSAKRKKRPAPRALSDRQEFKASHLTSLLGLVVASVS